MVEPDTTLRLVTSLWHSNFKNLEMRENGNVFVIEERFNIHALNLLTDLAESYNRLLIIYPTIATHEVGMIRAIFISEEGNR